MPRRRLGVLVYPTWTDWTRALLALSRGQRKAPETYRKVSSKPEIGGVPKTLSSRSDARRHTAERVEMFRYALAHGCLK